MHFSKMCLTAGPGDAPIMPHITDQGNGNFRVDYTPTIAGTSLFEYLF